MALCMEVDKGFEEFINNHNGPKLSVDVIIRYKGGIVLVKRKFRPFGLALPGGYVEYGESVEQAVIREAKEETNLDLVDLQQFHTYSDPKRDTRHHTISVAFVAEGKGELIAGDDAAETLVVPLDKVPSLCFDHSQIILDYINEKYKVY